MFEGSVREGYLVDERHKLLEARRPCKPERVFSGRDEEVGILYGVRYEFPLFERQDHYAEYAITLPAVSFQCYG